MLSNACKHAFSDREKGNICISVHALEDEQYELVVSDDGIGIPSAIDFQTAKSLGLRLVNILVKNQLNGNITLDRSSGTSYKIIFGDR
jgi:two-component sensor histidine kinase